MDGGALLKSGEGDAVTKLWKALVRCTPELQPDPTVAVYCNMNEIDIDHLKNRATLFHISFDKGMQRPAPIRQVLQRHD